MKIREYKYIQNRLIDMTPTQNIVYTIEDFFTALWGITRPYSVKWEWIKDWHDTAIQ